MPNTSLTISIVRVRLAVFGGGLLIPSRSAPREREQLF